MAAWSERSTNMAMGRFTARESWNMFSSMSRLGFSKIDEDDVGLDIGDAARDAGHVMDDGQVVVARLAQAGLDHRGPQAVFVDDEDREGGRPGVHAGACAGQFGSLRAFSMQALA